MGTHENVDDYSKMWMGIYDDDLMSIINFYKFEINEQHIDHCTSEKDFTKLKCDVRNGQGNNIFSSGSCEMECAYLHSNGQNIVIDRLQELRYIRPQISTFKGGS